MELINQTIFLGKKLLFKALSTEQYLRFLSNSFLKAYKLGILKKRFPQHYFVKNLIDRGDYIIDIGANLGYYSCPCSLATGKEGKVFSIEPVSLFCEVLNKNLKRFSSAKNFEIKNVALGSTEEHGKELFMGIFIKNGIFRHGLTRVVDQDENCYMRFKTKMQCPDILFKDLNKLNFIKCDVEGYETHIIPFFKTIIEKFHPKIQIEISTKENYDIIKDILSKAGYSCYILTNHRLRKANSYSANFGDLYFIHNQDDILESKHNLFE
ncbi:MAG: FkbM family methyltransferase [Bacteroidales bacterium]